MTLTLHIDTDAWREHLRQVVASTPGIIPVAKGNGYGFGIARLAREAGDLGVDCLAVGTLPEVRIARDAGWSGDIVVLTPWSPFDGTDLIDDPGLILTIGRVDDLRELLLVRPNARVEIELLTRMMRHGVNLFDLEVIKEILQAHPDATLEAWTIHLPLATKGSLLPFAQGLADGAVSVIEAPVWISHLSPTEYEQFSSRMKVPTRMRVGTRLWLGAPSTRRMTARVLDLHPVTRGQRVGYWQHRVPAAGWVVAIGGGTAHGVAMEAPSAGANARQRLVAATSGGMEAMGLALSPFQIGGRKRFFIEPPHMQESLVFVPGASASVAIGDEVPLEARMTTVLFDRVIG